MNKTVAQNILEKLARNSALPNCVDFEAAQKAVLVCGRSDLYEIVQKRHNTFLSFL